MTDLERVEIVKGPGAVQYGSDAIGGVINVITFDPLKTDGLGLSYRLLADSNPNHWTNARRLSWGSSRFAIKATGRFSTSDNYEDLTSHDALAQIPPVTVHGLLRLYSDPFESIDGGFIQFDVKYAGAQDRISQTGSLSITDDTVTGQYLTVDASIGVRLKTRNPTVRPGLFIKMENLADTAYRDHLSSMLEMGWSINPGYSRSRLLRPRIWTPPAALRFSRSVLTYDKGTLRPHGLARLASGPISTVSLRRAMNNPG